MAGAVTRVAAGEQALPEELARQRQVPTEQREMANVVEY
jgi:hypothetical protein